MEFKKKIATCLKKDGESNLLIFKFESGERVINLNSEDQSPLKDLFYFIINELFNGPFQIDKPDTTNYDVALYKDICNDYIDKLNEEIKTVSEIISNELKLKE